MVPELIPVDQHNDRKNNAGLNQEAQREWGGLDRWAYLRRAHKLLESTDFFFFLFLFFLISSFI